MIKHRRIKGAELSNLSRHHRRPRSLQGKSEARNISYVNPKQHAAWHQLFGNKTPEEIAKFINNVWLDPDYRFVAVYVNHTD